jgi:hypothetical protein
MKCNIVSFPFPFLFVTVEYLQIENHPENSKSFTLLFLSRIRHHDTSLCGPQETSTNTKNGTSSDGETVTA